MSTSMSISTAGRRRTARSAPVSSTSCAGASAPPERMDKFTALRVFTRVVEHGGFTAAAARLGQSPSAVTKTISRLEDELGAQLFNRSTRRLRTTDFGREFYERS